MRIVLIGQAPFGAKTLEALLERGEDVVAVYAPRDKPGAKPDPLKVAAEAGGIALFQPATYRNDDVFSQYRDLQPDLTILAFVTDIIPVRFLELPASGTICYHPSILPRHRGASAINWAVIMGDDRTGLTVFWPDGGIDTGPILLQKEIAIQPDDSTGSLYFNHLFPMGIEAMVESVELIKEGKAPRIPQDAAKATYEPPCDDRVASIEWMQPAREVYNLVRGCDPQPGAYSFWNGEKVRFYNAKLIAEPTQHPPGTVSQIGQDGIRIAVPGGILVTGSVRPQSSGKQPAADWAKASGLRVGSRFGGPE